MHRPFEYVCQLQCHVVISLSRLRSIPPPPNLGRLSLALATDVKQNGVVVLGDVSSASSGIRRPCFHTDSAFAIRDQLWRGRAGSKEHCLSLSFEAARPLAHYRPVPLAGDAAFLPCHAQRNNTPLSPTQRLPP